MNTTVGGKNLPKRYRARFLAILITKLVTCIKCKSELDAYNYTIMSSGQTYCHECYDRRTHSRMKFPWHLDELDDQIKPWKND